MVKNYKDLITKHFKEHSIVDANITSFDNFIDKGLQKIVDEINEVVPTIIPEEAKDYKIRLNKIWIEKPQIIEADGSKRPIYPIEARLRKLTYSAPINLEVSAYINGIQKESFITEIGRMPIMLKSKYCHLNGLTEEELIEKGEDPNDPGGYFVLNGNERVLIIVEDLAPNKLFFERRASGPMPNVAKLFSEKGNYKIPHLIEQSKEGVIYLSFTRFKKIPIIKIIKALGLESDQEINNLISPDKEYDDIFINLFECKDIKNKENAKEELAKQSVASIASSKEERIARVENDIDKYLLPHLGIDAKDRYSKAINLCKIIRKFLLVFKDNKPIIEKDHYLNKRLKLSGDLLEDLFRVNLRVLVNDMLYNFQRLVKRGKFQSVKIIIRNKLLTSRITSAMATGAWTGGRKGISQNIDRTNFLATTSHLRRVVSLLSASQENFDARALHNTHWGRLCPIETPEGTPIGLRKNLAILCDISKEEISDEKVKKTLEFLGLITGENKK